MDIFATVKAAVTVRQAAEHYGLQVSRKRYDLLSLSR